MSEWHPIDTAPCDGTAVWLLFDGTPFIGYGEPADGVLQRSEMWFGKTYVQRRVDGQRTDNIYSTHVMGKPTHWMPLPEPPK